MMESSTFVMIAIYAILIIILWKIFKTIGKVILFLSLITIVGLGVATYLVIQDVKSFKEGATQGQVVLYTQNNKVVSGFILDNGVPTLISEQQKQDYTTLYQEEQYVEILQDRFKLFIVTQEALHAIDDLSLETPDFTLSDEAVRTGMPFQPSAAFAQVADYELVPDSEKELFVLTSVFSQKIIGDPFFMISSYKEETLMVYPETALFTVFKIVPLGLLKATTVKLVEKTKEGGEIVIEKLE